jgi:hypothetical protein
MKFDPALLGKMLAGEVRGYVERAINPLLVRMAVLETQRAEAMQAGHEDTIGDLKRIAIEARATIAEMIAFRVSFEKHAGDELRELRSHVEAIPRPADGKDADPAVVEALVAKAVAAIPRPADGKDADPAVVEQFVAKAVAAIPRPADGKDADPAVVEALVAKAVAAIPRPADGKDADPAVVEALVAKAVAAIPRPADGKDADPAVVEALVAKAVAAIPRPADGKDADPAVVEALVAKAVAAIPRPADGVGVAGAVIDRSGNLLLTLSNGAIKELGCIVGRDADPQAVRDVIKAELDQWPRPKDGKDGVSFEDWDLHFDHEQRALNLSLGGGDHRQERSCKVGVLLDRGVWKEGRGYERGDGVTWRGSFWIAQKETSAKPDEASSDWRLAVKRGRDGKDKL